MAIKISALPEIYSMADADYFVMVSVNSLITHKIAKGVVIDVIEYLANSKSHTQNTDVGTTSETFQLAKTGSGVVLKDIDGSLVIRNYNDTTYTDITSSNAYFINDMYSNTAHIGSDVNGSLIITGSVYIDGPLYAEIKHFYINHPTKDDQKLIYSSLESPYNGVRLTGKDSVYNGVGVVCLPYYMRDLVGLNNIHINLTPYQNSKIFYVNSIDLEENLFYVKVKLSIIDKILIFFKKTLNYEFYWDFTAERKDIKKLEVEPKN